MNSVLRKNIKLYKFQFCRNIMLYSMKKHLQFSKKEVRDILITGVVFGFILSFRLWGGENFNFKEGFINFLAFFVLSFLIIYLSKSVQKMVSIKLGYIATHKYSWMGLLVGLTLCFYTNGFIFILLPGSVVIEHVATLRLGKFRYGLNYKDLAKIAFAAPFVCLLIAILLKPIYFATKIDFIFKIIKMNLMLVVFSLLPIPSNDGMHLFRSSPKIWVFLMSTALVFSLLVFWNNLFALILSILAGLIMLFVFISQVEGSVK